MAFRPATAFRPARRVAVPLVARPVVASRMAVLWLAVREPADPQAVLAAQRRTAQVAD